MALACRLHLATVVPVKSVQAGNILMGFCAGVDKAAGILFPRAALLGWGEGRGTLSHSLGVRERVSSHTQHNQNIHSSPLQSLIPHSLQRNIVWRDPFGGQDFPRLWDPRGSSHHNIH